MGTMSYYWRARDGSKWEWMLIQLLLKRSTGDGKGTVVWSSRRIKTSRAQELFHDPSQSVQHPSARRVPIDGHIIQMFQNYHSSRVLLIRFSCSTHSSSKGPSPFTSLPQVLHPFLRDST